MSLSLSSFKEWLPFAFIIVGIGLALIAPFVKSGLKRRARTRQLLENFVASLHNQDIAYWSEIYHGRREAASAPAGYFINRLGKPESLASMFVGDGEEHTAIQRMAEGLETVCTEMLAHSVDNKVIWAEIGQLMESLHDWLQDIPGVQQDVSFLQEQYPSLKLIFEQYGSHFKSWPCRDYAKH
jgi:hypothetical protein